MLLLLLPLLMMVVVVMMLLMLQIKAECLGCRHNAAMFNMSYFGKFYLTGPDAQAAADFIFTNDVRLQPGQLHHQAAAVTCAVSRMNQGVDLVGGWS